MWFSIVIPISHMEMAFNDNSQVKPMVFGCVMLLDTNDFVYVKIHFF